MKHAIFWGTFALRSDPKTDHDDGCGDGFGPKSRSTINDGESLACKVLSSELIPCDEYIRSSCLKALTRNKW